MAVIRFSAAAVSFLYKGGFPLIYLLWVAVLVCIAGALALTFNEKLELCLAPAVCGSIALLYLFGLAGFLYAGLWAVAGCGALSAALIALQCLRQRRAFIRQWFTPAMGLFALAVVYIAWAQGGRVVIGNDEFSHWAATVKMMVHLDALSITEAGRMQFPTYPPATALFEYLFVRLTPAFTEGYLYRALNLMQVSLLVPYLSRFNLRRSGMAAAGFAALYLLPLAFYPEFYTDLCVDGTLALLFAWTLYSWFGRRKRDAFAALWAALGCFTLTLTKDSGLLFALVALLLILWDSTRQRAGTIGDERGLKAALTAQKCWLWAAGAVLLAKASWSVVCAVQLGGGGGGASVLHNLLKLLGPWPERYSITLYAFLRGLLYDPGTDAPIPVPMLLWLVLGALALGFSGQLHRTARPALMRLRRGLSLGFFVYAAGLLYLYFFKFSEYEGTRVLSQHRYLSTWLLTMAVLGVGLLLDCAARREVSRHLPMVLLACTLLVFPSQTKVINNLVAAPVQIAQDRAARLVYPTAETFPEPLAEGDRVYFIGEDTAVYESLCARYSLYPTVCDASLGHNFHLGAGYDVWATDVSADAWAAELAANYTHVYIYSISGAFVPKYGHLFADPASIAGGAVYRVDKAADAVTLVRIN